MNARQHSWMNTRMQIISSTKALFCNCFSPLSLDEIFGPLNFRTNFFQLLDFADRKGVLFLVFFKGFPYSDSCTFHICCIIIIWDLKGGDSGRATVFLRLIRKLMTSSYVHWPLEFAPLWIVSSSHFPLGCLSALNLLKLLHPLRSFHLAPQGKHLHQLWPSGPEEGTRPHLHPYHCSAQGR